MIENKESLTLESCGSCTVAFGASTIISRLCLQKTDLRWQIHFEKEDIAH